jgi:glycosyltransferase involved in cell wall biosynthesis
MSRQENQSSATAHSGKSHELSPQHPRRRILFVTRTYEYGGAEKHLIQLIHSLLSPDLQISLLCLGADPYTERLESHLGVEVKKSEGEPASLFDWIRLLRSEEPEVAVFIYGWNSCFHWRAPFALWLTRIKRRFAIEHLFLTKEGTKGLLARTILRIMGPLNQTLSAAVFHKIICVSDNLRETLVKVNGFPARKMVTIRNGVALSEFAPNQNGGLGIRAKFGIGPDEFLLVCAARLSAQKGIDILVDAISLVLRNGVACKCIIVGDGPLREQLVRQVSELGLSDMIFFEGFQADVRPYLYAGSALVLTSHSEGLPLAILEALATGLPCIVTAVGGNREAVTHEVNGLVVPPDSVEAVSEAVSYLATHPQERARMSRMARAGACERFNIETSMAEIKQVVLG